MLPLNVVPQVPCNSFILTPKINIKLTGSSMGVPSVLCGDPGCSSRPDPGCISPPCGDRGIVPNSEGPVESDEGDPPAPDFPGCGGDRGIVPNSEGPVESDEGDPDPQGGR